jgi:lysozyme
MRLNQRRLASAIESLESRLLMRAEGVDVSLYQGDINWNTMASHGKQFAFIRSSRTNLTKDSYFDANVSGSTAAGLIVGAYHFCLPNGLNEAGPETDPVADAQKFYAAGKSAMGTGFIRPVMDVEAGNSLGKTELSNWVLAFSNELQRLTGVKPLIYCSTSYATTYLDTRVSANNDLWIARWNNNNAGTLDPQTAQPETPSGYPNAFGSWNVPLGGAPNNSVWDFWQYTSNGDGILYGASSTRLDMDVYNGDLNSLKQNFMIGYQKAFVGPLIVATGATTVIQAEYYDIGGEGVSYHDTTPTSNTGNVFRTSVREGVDLLGIPNTANYRITDSFAGEWVEYTVDVNQAGL